MSVFWMKLLAVVSMVIDHIGVFLFPRFVSHDVYLIFRSIGRFAFPVYCFLIVNGSQKTGDVKRYLTRLIAFAVISQIPFVMTFDANPFPAGGGLHFAPAYRGFLCAAMIFAACAAWFAAVRPGTSVLWVLLALGAAVCRVDYDGVRLLSGELNVFYTLALGLACVCLLDAALKPERDVVRLLLQALGLFAAFFLIRENADYGAMGVVLIVSLWLTRGSRLSQAAVLLIWCGIKYYKADGDYRYFLCAALSLLPVLLYNGRLGRPMRSAFYLVYPIHLAVLGALTVYYTLA